MQNKNRFQTKIIVIIIFQLLLSLFIIVLGPIQPNFLTKISDIYVINESKIFYVYKYGNSYVDPIDPKGEKCLIPWKYTQNISQAKLIMYNTLDNYNQLTHPRDRNLRPDQATCIESMESATYYPALLRNKKNFNYSMYYSLTSDVPIPYSEYFTTNEKPLKLSEKKGNLAAAFISNCHDNNHRLGYVKKLMKYMKVDSYGSCANNAQIPSKWKRKTRDKTKEAVISHYKFTLAFENSNDWDYVTEKLYQPLRYGSVPICRGCPNVEDFAPPNSFIDANKFQSPQKLAEYINYLDTHDDEYNKYLEWKEKNNLGNLAKVLFFRDRHEFGICALIERMHGLWINPFLVDWKRVTSSYLGCNMCRENFDFSKRRIPVLNKEGTHYEYPLNEYWSKVFGNKSVNTLKFNYKLPIKLKSKSNNMMISIIQKVFSIFSPYV